MVSPPPIGIVSGEMAAAIEQANTKCSHQLETMESTTLDGDGNADAGDEDDDFLEVAKVEGLDWFVRQLWPHLERMMQRMVETKIEPAIDKELDKHGIAGKALKGIKFTRFDLGDKRPVVGPIRAYRKSKHDLFGIEIDCDMKLDCEPHIDMTVRSMTAGIKRLKFEGTVSVILKPIMDVAPIIGGAQLFLLNRPAIDFELAGALEHMNFSVIHNVLKKVVDDLINQTLVLPTRMHLNIMKEWQLKTDVVSLYSPVPEGIVRVMVVSATNLPATDVQLSDLTDFSKWWNGGRRTLGTVSDPFCEVRIGAKTFRTETVKQTLNPVWTSGNVADFLVYNLAQKVSISVFDDDFGYSASDELGTAMLRVESLIHSEIVTIPIHLSEDLQEENADVKGSRSSAKDAEGKSPYLTLRVQYFAPNQPESADVFHTFRERHHGPSEGLLGVKIYGMRTLGPKSSVTDGLGKVFRVTLRESGGSTTCFCSKPSQIRGTHVALDGIDAVTVEFVQNLSLVQPDMSLEDIAEAAELHPETVESILGMNELLPIVVNAGFFFLVSSHDQDRCLIEILPSKSSKKPTASFQVPLSDIVAAEGMRLKRHFTVQAGELHPLSGSQDDVEEEDQSNAASSVREFFTTGTAKIASSLGLKHRETGVHRNGDHDLDHHDDHVNHFNSQLGFEIAMELRLYSLFACRRTCEHYQNEREA